MRCLAAQKPQVRKEPADARFGLQAQVLRTAQRLLSTGRVRAVQLEVTKTKSEMPAYASALVELAARGFVFKQVPNSIIDSNVTLPSSRRWRDAPGPWKQLPNFPAWRRGSRNGTISTSAMMQALATEMRVSLSTNLIGRVPRATRGTR